MDRCAPVFRVWSQFQSEAYDDQSDNDRPTNHFDQ